MWLCCFSGPSTSAITFPEEDFLKELQAQGGKTGGQHVKLLLQKTQEQRRSFASKAETTKEIIVEFPHLQNYDLVCSSF